MTILPRSGTRLVGTYDIGEINKLQLVTLMVGKDMENNL